MFLKNGHFLQIIERCRDELYNLYSKIERDPRPKNINKLADEPVSGRAFESWKLDGFHLGNPELINPQILTQLRPLYNETFGSDVAGLIDFIKHMVEEMDTYKIKSDLKRTSGSSRQSIRR